MRTPETLAFFRVVEQHGPNFAPRPFENRLPFLVGPREGSTGVLPPTFEVLAGNVAESRVGIEPLDDDSGRFQALLSRWG